MSPPVFSVALGDAQSVRQRYRAELSHGGCFIASAARPAPFSIVRVRFELPVGPAVDVSAAVVNQTAVGFYVQFTKGPDVDALVSAVEFLESLASGSQSGLVEDQAVPLNMTSEPDERRELRAAALAAAASADALPAELRPSDEQTSAHQPAPGEVFLEALPEAREPGIGQDALLSAGGANPLWSWIKADAPLREQLAALSADQRRQLARLGPRAVRDALVGDSDLGIAREAVLNPRATEDELLAWLDRDDLALDTLLALAHSRAARCRPKVRAALAQHPRLPDDERAAHR